MLPRALAFERVSRARLPDIPRTFIKLLQDRTVSLEGQEQLIKNLGGANVLTLDTGHTAMVSRPQELAQLLNQIAAAGQRDAAVPADERAAGDRASPL